MNWLILIAASTISAAIILYSLWPATPELAYRRKFISLLALVALTLPAGLNYYLIERTNNNTAANVNAPIDFAELGNPEWTGPISRNPQPAADQMSMSSVTSRLETKLRNSPDDIGGWILLGRSYVALGQPERAMTLFEEIIEANPDNIDLLLSYGETLSQINQGNISGKAEQLFEKASQIEPSNPRAEYNLAQYDIQQGQFQKAYDRLAILLENAPAEAPWITQVRQRMNVAAESLGKAPRQPAMASPTAEQVEQVTNMSASDQSAFIRSMVDGLAEKLKENPDDLEGWLNLARSYGVLEEWQNSADAYEQAIRLSPEDERLKEQYKSTLTKASKF